MRVETVRTYESKLPPPASDPHPYRTGAWTPNTVEVDAYDLEVVAGAIPDDLEGVYLRNTENPLFDAITGRYHPFDGDAMLHAIRFGGGKADYRNRFVRTAGLLAELEAGEALWAGILERADQSKRPDGWGARTRMKDASSTDVIVHGGVALTSFYQCGDAYRVDPLTLETLGVANALAHPGFPRGATMSAHPKVDEAGGENELLFFNYSADAPYRHVGIADAKGALLRAIPVPLPGPRLPHDMAFTERFAILGDFPLFWDPKKLAEGAHRARWYPELGSRFALVPRDGVSPIRWFTASPTYVLHFSNAWEEEDGNVVVLEGYHQESALPERGPDDNAITLFMKSLDMDPMRTRLHRWRFDLRTGAVKEEFLDDAVSEFPTIDARRAGRKTNILYAATGAPGFFLFDGFVRTDTRTGRKQTYRLPKGVYGSEAPFAPRRGATSEEDGYLVTFTTDVNEDRSECLIFDAKEIDRGPIARVRLPHRISSGTHACWMPVAYG